MIGEALIDLFFAIMRGAFSSFVFISLPVELIQTLGTILSYGVWIVCPYILYSLRILTSYKNHSSSEVLRFGGNYLF